MNEKVDNPQNANPNKETNKNFFDYNCQNPIENLSSGDLSKLIALQSTLGGLSRNNSNNITPTINQHQPNLGMMITTNLINELLELEQQNRIQIELFQRIIQNKFQNISYANNILKNFINQSMPDKNQGELTTKGSSNYNDKAQEGNGQQSLNINEERQISKKKFFFIVLKN